MAPIKKPRLDKVKGSNFRSSVREFSTNFEAENNDEDYVETGGFKIQSVLNSQRSSSMVEIEKTGS